MGDFQILELDHVQLAMPDGQEHLARAFYSDVLGLTEEPTPANLAARGGVWFRGGGARLHLGVEREFRAARLRRTPPSSFVVSPNWQSGVAMPGSSRSSTNRSPGFDRFYVFDPFGNRLELLEPVEER